MTLGGIVERARGAAGDPRADGKSVALLARFGRHFAAAVRVAILGPLGTIALLRASGEHAPLTAVVVAGVVAWSAVYVWWLLRCQGGWATAVDAMVLVLACLSIPLTNAAEQGNVGWIRLLVSFACVAYQWYTPLTHGVVATLVPAGTLLTVVLLADSAANVVNAAIWVLATVFLSRMAWTLVEQGARTADRLALDAQRARQAQQVAVAVRADERELVNALHDTAATTLLMVGGGQVPPGVDWLASRARRDLETLRAYGAQTPELADLVQLLHVEAEAVGQPRVRFAAPPRLLVPYRIGRAVADAAREAMNNVVRHASAQDVQVRLSGDSRRLRVDVIDDGKGFVPAEVPATRRGLRDCVRGRLAGVGGDVEIVSRAGHGTVVTLEWCDE